MTSSPASSRAQRDSAAIVLSLNKIDSMLAGIQPVVSAERFQRSYTWSRAERLPAQRHQGNLPAYRALGSRPSDFQLHFFSFLASSLPQILNGDTETRITTALAPTENGPGCPTSPPHALLTSFQAPESLWWQRPFRERSRSTCQQGSRVGRWPRHR